MKLLGFRVLRSLCHLAKNEGAFGSAIGLLRTLSNS